jgi:hypothetical protein
MEIERQVDIHLKFISDFAIHDGFEPYDDITNIPTNLRTLIEAISVSYMNLDGHWKGMPLSDEDYKRSELYFEKGSIFLKNILSKDAYQDFIRLCKTEPYWDLHGLGNRRES